MHFKAILASTTVLILFAYGAETGGAAEIKKKGKPRVLPVSARTNTSPSRIAEIHKKLLEKKIASTDALRRLLADDEKRLGRESAEYESKKRDYQHHLISQQELVKSAQAVSRTRGEIERLRHWIAEDDTALALAGYVRREQQEPMAETPHGSTVITRAFIRYNGLADWSLADAGKISKFFLDHFGHDLPISAMGQSATHDRMGLDHHEAMDVAVQPDSPEGRGLMAYLRQAGIPFIAFRNRVRGMATGAHIHIGRPSLRLLHVRQTSPSAAAEEKEG
jgi:hypothetical protein